MHEDNKCEKDEAGQIYQPMIKLSLLNGGCHDWQSDPLHIEQVALLYMDFIFFLLTNSGSL
jgi:hypothetical protein